MDWTADRLNEHLANGGAVQVTTYLSSTVYTAKHAGWFSQRGDELYVRRGRGADCLGPVAAPYVGIRLGRVKTPGNSQGAAGVDTGARVR